MINTFEKPLTYNPQTGRWSLELHKAPKFFSAQCGVKVTVDAGTPTGEIGPFYEDDENKPMSGSILEVRYFDNLSGYTSIVEFDLPVLIKKLIEIMPPENVRTETFCLAAKDREEVHEI